jgi:hypothetical protein
VRNGSPPVAGALSRTHRWRSCLSADAGNGGGGGNQSAYPASPEDIGSINSYSGSIYKHIIDAVAVGVDVKKAATGGVSEAVLSDQQHRISR